ncbi:MAG: ferrochelatase [Alphaproteobacteria bacterium]|nr:ferrochelatase [Alphaproteobacteria bacterium]MBV9694130.1 ferrochelatase [Alphaproteobacteria bacterium]
MRLAVVLFNLGGPDSMEAVEPFLRNLFSDPAILPLPWFLRLPLARLIARRRAPIAREIYEKLGGRSPILEETQAQAGALEQMLKMRGHDARCFVAMRCWGPSSDAAAGAVRTFAPERIALLPLYPQYSTTTTASSLKDWSRAAAAAGIVAPQAAIRSYPTAAGFIEALAEGVREAWGRMRPGIRYRLLLSAHGLPQRVIAAGDPYRHEVEQTAASLVAALGMPELDCAVCYQSRVGPLKWIGPATDAEIVRAGSQAMGLIVAPIAFVSEHSETLVELDIEYARLAEKSGVPHYLRAPTVGTRPPFIQALAELALKGDR